MTETPDVRVGVLGPFQAKVDGSWLPAPTRQVGRVGTMLAGWPGESLDRDRLIIALWGDTPPATATNTLQVHISHLRRFLGKDLVLSTPQGYQLALAPEEVDTGSFLAGLERAFELRRAGDVRAARERLLQVVDLWRGTPYPGVRDPELIARRAGLVEFCEQAREDLLDCCLEIAADDFQQAVCVAEAKELVARQPHRERTQALLVRALVAADRRGEALMAYDTAVAYLHRTQRMAPGRWLTDAHDALTAAQP